MLPGFFLLKNRKKIIKLLDKKNKRV